MVALDPGDDSNIPILHLAHLPGSMITRSAQPAPAPAPRAAPGASPGAIHVATVNVRYDGSWHKTPIPPSGVVNPKQLPKNPYAEQDWAVRRSRLVDALFGVGHLDIVGFQEVLHSQLLDLEVLLGPRFAHVGVGRDDGRTRGEYAPIFYDRNRFEQVNWKTIWLSPTPAVPGSVGWDASQTRIATLLTLREKCDGSFVHAICTHYDHIGVRARANSSLLIRTAIHDWVTGIEGRTSSDSPVILFGDFNSPEWEDGYKNITSPKPLSSPSFTFLDAYTNLCIRSPQNPGVQSKPYGPANTWTGFAGPGQEETSRIDFIMLGVEPADRPDAKPQTPWAFTQFAVIDNWIEEGDESGWRGRWSDHRAVRATLERVSI